MDPITLGIVGGIAVGSAAMQWLNSERGRKASAREREAMMALVEKTELPDFDLADLTPEEYQLVGTYIPQVAPFVEEAAPELIRGQSEGAIRGREAEMEALARLRDMSMAGEDPLAVIQRNRAAREASQGASAARATALNQMAQRGMGGNSGLGFAAQLQGNSDAFLANALAGEQAAADAQGRRISALNDMASLGGQIRASDLDIESRNAQATNAFNQRLAANKQAWMNSRADIQNEAQRYNLGQRQDTMNRNTDLRNNYRQYNRNYKNDMKQRDFGNRLEKIALQTGQGQGRINDIAATTTQQNQAIQGLGDAGMAAARYATGYKRPEDERKR